MAESDPPAVDGAAGEAAPSAATASGPAGYFADAIRIARLDTTAIVRVAADRVAIVYAAIVFTIVAFVQLLVLTVTSAVTRAGQGSDISLIALVLAMPITFVLQILLSAATIALLHGLAKVLFGATGTVLGLIRVLWLGSFVQLLVIVPVIGGIVAGIWMLLITIVTFEEVDGIERLQALALSVGLGAATQLLLMYLR